MKNLNANDAVPEWHTSAKEQVDGYHLLRSLYMHRQKQLDHMTPEQVWASHPEFKKYDFVKFTENGLQSRRHRLKKRRPFSLMSIDNLF
jgi:hypothetical protein